MILGQVNNQESILPTEGLLCLGRHLALMLKQTEIRGVKAQVCRRSLLCHLEGEFQVEIPLSAVHFSLTYNHPAGKAWDLPGEVACHPNPFILQDSPQRQRSR